MDFSSLISNTNFLQSFSNSLLIGLGTSMGAISLGLILAITLERTAIFGKSLFQILLLLPFLIPPYIHTLAWSWLFAGEGFLVSILGAPTEIAQTLYTLLYSRLGVICILTIYCTPLATIIIASGLRLSSGSGEEAALMARPPMSVLFRHTLPSISPHLAGSSLITMVISMLNFSVADILRVHVLPIEIFIQLSVFYDQFGAFTMSIPLFGITATLIVLFQRVMGDKQFICTRQQQNRSALTYSLGKPFLIICTSLFITSATISLLPPLMYLIGSLSQAQEILSTIFDSYGEILYTFALSGGSSVVTVCIGLPVAYFLSRRRTWSATINFIFLLPLAIPGALLALGMLRVNDLPVLHHLSSTSIPCVLALCLHFLPFAVKLLEAELHKIDVKLEEIARLFDGSVTHRLRYILLPLLLPGLTISFFFVFILSLGDLSIPLLLVPPGRETVPVKIYNLMHYGANDMVAVLCLFILFTIGSISILTLLWYKRCQMRLSN